MGTRRQLITDGDKKMEDNEYHHHKGDVSTHGICSLIDPGKERREASDVTSTFWSELLEQEESSFIEMGKKTSS